MEQSCWTIVDVRYCIRLSKRIKRVDGHKNVEIFLNKALIMSQRLPFNGNIGGTVWGVSLAAKTGTTNYSDETIAAYGFPYSAINDLWTAGYTPEISVALWYGYDTPVAGYYNTNGYEKNNLYPFLCLYRIWHDVCK